MKESRIPKEWKIDFEAALRRSLKDRMNYSFIHTFKPVIDEAPYRVFETMEAYRRWCQQSLPSYLGYA